MAQTVVGVNLATDDGVAVAGWNNFYDAQNDAAGQLSSDLLDTADAPTGYTLTLNGPFAGALGTAGFATSSPDPRFPLLMLHSAWYVSLVDDDAAAFTIGNLPVGATYKIESAAANGNASRPTTFSATGSSPTSATYSPDTIDPVPQPVLLEGTVPAGGEVTLNNIGSSTFAYNNGFLLTVESAGPQTIRKGSQFTVEETLAGTVVSATLNGNAITVDSHVGTTVTLTDTGSGITTSGEYPLALTDDSATPQTETITVQVNVVGLANFNINKDGADQGSLTDVEFIILTGAAGSRAINQQVTGVTTTVGGDTGSIEIADTALNAGDTIMVAQRSDTVSGGGGAFHPATLGLI